MALIPVFTPSDEVLHVLQVAGRGPASKQATTNYHAKQLTEAEYQHWLQEYKAQSAQAATNNHPSGFASVSTGTMLSEPLRFVLHVLIVGIVFYSLIPQFSFHPLHSQGNWLGMKFELGNAGLKFQNRA